ncbi:MAG TPA: PAS domain S-box protein, partial [Baekduia sp.]|nr:PAS domain S-box protein [Baekduia sp.]
RARRAIERIAESVEAFLFTRRLDADGVARLVYAGRGVERLLGGPVPPGGTIDQAWADALLPDDRARAQAALAATMRGEPSLVEYRLAGLDGRVRWVRARMQRREEHGVVYVDGMISDVTAERAHAEEMARFRGAVEASGSAIALLDLDWRVRWMNSAGLRLTGLTAQDAQGIAYLELVGDAARADHMNVERPAVERDGRWAGESVLQPVDRSDRSRRPLPVDATTYRIAHPATGAPLGLACIRRDISELRRLAREHEAIGSLTTAIAAGAGREEIYEAACGAAAQLLDAGAGAIAKLSPTGAVRTVGTWRAPGADDRLELAIGRLAPQLCAAGAATRALALGDRHHGLGAAVLVEGRPWGLIVACRDGPPFTGADERALSRLAAVAGAAVAMAIARERLVGRRDRVSGSM